MDEQLLPLTISRINCSYILSVKTLELYKHNCGINLNTCWFKICWFRLLIVNCWGDLFWFNWNLLINSLLVTGFSYDRFTLKDNNYAEFCWLTNKTRGVRRGGAAAVDLAFVAAGRLDGYWEKGLSKWDLAAGVALVEQAGGVVSDYPIDEFNLTNGRVLACTPGIHKELRGQLSQVIPLEVHSYGALEIKDKESWINSH